MWLLLKMLSQKEKEAEKEEIIVSDNDVLTELKDIQKQIIEVKSALDIIESRKFPMIREWCNSFFGALPYPPSPYRYEAYTEMIMERMANELTKGNFDFDEFCKEVSWLLKTGESKQALNQQLEELRKREKRIKDKLGIT
ncbi:hypothetical protein [Ruminococcus sp. YE282]|uniref:hypothetical protein n=1 Tax=Ruminococcus sp. YE282 TaxID=3158780 RepID=UPI00088CA36A|nr:hypothetical protein SAMN02910441_00237 [Ruminococcus bromii]